ncbi:helix-turn-helix transcriptional regulator [Oscillatoria sp. FACHB-1407]|uniref:helix-turn-helix transcriptional regulator n=1 Tax=Oscillatoria sp. FACHB-1407 TaxID=2692847 RepID=UPI0016827026|nr:AraC family transcriptional regulator [Oscillatoria sp. FACHB-1407]MBD2465692.1 helix-turn-helix transcriptional regulator [Oscillatoria sp. FACHB-1407]
MAEQSFILQEDWLETVQIQMRVFTEAPVDGLTWYEGYSDPCLVVNFNAQLAAFEVEAAGGKGYKGPIVPGDFSFLPPGSTFGGYYKGAHMRYASITFPAESLNPQFADGKPLIMHSDPLIRGLAEALYSQGYRNDPDVILYRESITNALIQHLRLIHLHPSTLDERQPINFNLLENYVQSKLDQKITIAELASIAGTTSQLLQRIVRKQFNQSVYEWVTTMRLRRSLELLRSSNLNLATIALETGFANQSHWTRLFRRQFGITPGKLRQH